MSSVTENLNGVSIWYVGGKRVNSGTFTQIPSLDMFQKIEVKDEYTKDDFVKMLIDNEYTVKVDPKADKSEFWTILFKR